LTRAIEYRRKATEFVTMTPKCCREIIVKKFFIKLKIEAIFRGMKATVHIIKATESNYSSSRRNCFKD
jgi:hypothetical protein